MSAPVNAKPTIDPSNTNGATPANGRERYATEIVPRFRALLDRTVPPGARVLVASKGDRAVVELDGREGSHFPQRGDGVYAGYYPSDSAAAITHLEELRERGADFIAFPATALWWLDQYREFGEHLLRSHRLIARHDDAGVVYALFDPRAETRAGEPRHDEPVAAEPAAPPPSADRVARADENKVIDEARALFDADHYAAQSGIAADAEARSFEHYMREGARRGFSPHPLFDLGWYARNNSDVAATGENPLLHFVRHCVTRQLDPNPFFDTAYYYEHSKGLREAGVNALTHYITHAPSNDSYHPNPLFRDGFYLRNYADARRNGTPLEHYLRTGWRDGRFVSDVHREIARHLAASGHSSLVRGDWKTRMVLLYAHGDARRGSPGIGALADRLATRYHLDAVVVAVRRTTVANHPPEAARLLVLEDYRLACDIMRPSALRLLTKTFMSARPVFAISELTDVLDTLADGGVGSYFLLPEPPELPPRPALAKAFEHASRVVVPSSSAFHAAAAAIGRMPVNVAVRSGSAGEHADALVDLAKRDFGLDSSTGAARRDCTPTRAARRIYIPCSDWGVSGVNASLEAVGRELIGLGWDVEIVFTRDERWVVDSAQGEANMPKLPYRYLDRYRPGIEGMWEALVADLEMHAPALVFTSYDFLANGVVPALTDRVAVAMWVQADDGDYYEQAYRLGRYCQAIVCVSHSIADRLAELNPALADRTHVIHNSSVTREDVATRRPARTKTLRIAYSGRLVQYQKRVGDFVQLADALERTGVPFEISLVGSFPAIGDVKERFLAAAAEHMDAGRIRLLGRLGREEIFAALDRSDFFVLLSDFEGLPLALVEAMARGCVPVAAEMESGIPEILIDGDNGLIVAGRDYDDWARRITELFDAQRRLAAMSKRARTTVRRNFTVERTAQQFVATFELLADAAANGSLQRPPSLHWGRQRSWTGDVLAPPSLVRPAGVHIGGLC